LEPPPEELAPVPLRLIACGLLLALSATDRVPVAAPTAVGVKVTLIVQLLLAARLVPQVLPLTANGALALMLVMLSAEPPVLDRVAVPAALVLPTLVVGKVKGLGERLAVGPEAAAPVPLRLMD
jgi:hypothetical protein